MNELKHGIGAILNEWDPIEVMEIAPRDEYYAYIPELVELVEAGEGEAFFYNHLVVVEQPRMYGRGQCKVTRRARQFAAVAGEWMGDEPSSSVATNSSK